MDAVALLERTLDPTASVPERFTAGTQLRNLLDATLLALSNQLAAGGDIAELRWQDTAHLSSRSVEREMRRARTVEQVPALGAALGDGQVSVDHVDVMHRALQRLDPAQRSVLLDDSEPLVEVARTETPERFERHLQDRLARLLSEHDREARLATQRRDTRLRTWIDRTTGMWNIRGEYDPVTGLQLQTALDARHDTLFATAVPDTAPDDPLERAHHLRALALVDLIDRPGNTVRPEVLVVIHQRETPAEPAGEASSEPTYTTDIEWRLPIEVPRSALELLVTDPNTLITPIIVRGDLVLHAPGQLHLGRSTRLANRAQRRALQALHPTCAIDGCTVPFDRCHIHHITWWRNGGTTDLHNLAPICTHHHTRIHQHQLDLPPPRARAA
jgi:hypothetical protein